MSITLDPILSDLTFIAFDFETTGLYPYRGDTICEIGAVRMRGEEVLGTFGTLVNPLRPISAGASAVNGITNDMVRDAPILERVFPDFMEFLGDAALVAHNAPFDMGFVSAALRQMDKPVPDNRIFDTLMLSRKLDPKMQKHSLHVLRERHLIEVPGEHRAVGDAMATAQLMGMFLNRIMERGIARLSGLEEFHGGAFRFETPRFMESAPDVPPEILEAVRQAVLGKRSLKIEYEDSWGKITERVIEPLDIVRRGNYHYISAQCLLRGDGRTFRIDRIKRLLHDS